MTLLTCRDCSELFREKPSGSPGYRNQCLDCSAEAAEPARYVASQCSDEAGTDFQISRGRFQALSSLGDIVEVPDLLFAHEAIAIRPSLEI